MSKGRQRSLRTRREKKSLEAWGQQRARADESKHEGPGPRVRSQDPLPACPRQVASTQQGAPVPARGARPWGGAGNTRRLRRSRGGRAAGRRCRFPIAPSQCRGRGARAVSRAPGSRDPGGAAAAPSSRLHPGPVLATCPPPSQAPPSSRRSRRRRRCGPRGRGCDGSGAGAGTAAARGGRSGGGAAGILRGAPMAPEVGECERHSPPAAASPRSAGSAPPGAARVAAAPQLRAPGRWLR